MEELWEITRAVLAVVMTEFLIVFFLWVVRVERKDRTWQKKVSAARVNARREATDAARKSWNGLYDDTCSRYEDRLKEKDAEIARLTGELARMQKRCSLMEALMNGVNLNNVRGK